MMRLQVVALAMLLGLVPAHAEPWEAPGGGFVVEFPDGTGWNALDVPRSATPSLPDQAQVVVRRAADAMRAAAVTVAPGTPEPELTDAIVAGFDKGLFGDNSARKLSSERVTVQGLPAYRYAAQLPNGVRVAGVLTVRDRVTYNLQAVSGLGDPMDDPELAAFLSSYRLP